MQKVMKIWISKTNHPKLFYFAKKNALLSKCLYNAALFRMRQTFTGWNKEKRTANENEIFTELELLRKHYPKLRIDQLLTYKALDKLMRVTHNPDYFAGLPMQTAEAVAREVQQNFDDWMKSLNSYKDDPTGYTGRPKMPGYLKGGEHTFAVTNQDAVLYPAKEGGADLKLPGFRKKEREHLEGITADCDLRQVVFKPFCGGYIMSLTVKEETLEMDEQLPNYAGIDLGADNLAAISCTDGSCIVYKGGAVLAANRRFAKERADAVSQITSGHKHKHADSRHLRFLSRRHEFFIYDQFHKITTDAVRWLAAHDVGTVVIGKNPLWKQKADMGRKNNQLFVMIPHDKFRKMLEYKAMRMGIIVIEQEESYTSKADVTAGDAMPVYGEEVKDVHFSGSRITRGLYRTNTGLLINADCNGAANILRKAYAGAWNNVFNFRFLATPEKRDFKDLNRPAQNNMPKIA